MRPIVVLALTFAAFPLLAGPSVDELRFMTGRWVAASDSTVREYTWSIPRARTMFGVMRRSGPETTAYVELLVISEEDDTLVLRFQQFAPDFEAVSPTRELTLSVLTEDSITFHSDSGDVRELAYSRLGTEFAVHGSTVNGEFSVLLQAEE